METVQSEATANDTARDGGRRLVGRGYAGLITAATFQSELTHLGVGFYANVGATAEVVEEHVRTHLVDASRHPGALNAEAADQLVDVVRTYLK